MFHLIRQLDSPLIGIFQSVASISTSMKLSLGSPLGLCDYLFLIFEVFIVIWYSVVLPYENSCVPVDIFFNFSYKASIVEAVLFY